MTRNTVSDTGIGRLKRAGLASMVAGFIVVGLAIPVGAHPADAADRPYEGFSTGSVVHIDAVNYGALRALDVEVGVSNASVDSDGLGRILSEYERTISVSDSENHARGHSTILEVGTLLNPRSAENQVKPWVAEVRANGDSKSNAVDKSVLKQAVSTALYADVLRNKGNARWNGDSCVLGSPISVGEQLATRLELLETAANASTEDFDKPIIALDAERIKRATSHVISQERLYRSGDRFGLQSVSATTLAPVTLLQGTPNEITIEVDGPAYLSAAADGIADGARIDYRSPIVSVTQAGGVPRQLLPASPLVVKVPGTGDVIAKIALGQVEPLPKPNGLGNETVTDDGTVAAAQAAIVEVELFDLTSRNFKALTFALGHMEAMARVPAGGIECSLPVTKEATPASVRVGNSFLTTITITNPYSCPVRNLSLVDAIRTEDAAEFSVSSTSPPATSSPTDRGLRTGTVKWNNLGTLRPGESRSVELRLLSEGGAGRIIDVATAGGSLDNCPVGMAEAGEDVTGLADVDVPVTGDARLTTDAAEVLGVRHLPRTGLPLAVPAGGGLGLLGLAGVVARLARKRPTRA